jgi:potassium efflux system protein
MPVVSFRLVLTLSLTIWLLLGWPLTGAAQVKPQPSEKKAAPATSPEVLPRMLAEGAAALEKEAGDLKSRAAVMAEGLARLEKDSQESRAVFAALKASLAVGSLPLGEAEAALKSYAQLQKQVEKRLKDLAGETEALRKEHTARMASVAALQAEVARLQGTRHPVARSKEMQQSWQRYQRAAAAVQQASGKVLESLVKESGLLEKKKSLLSEVQADLKPYVDAAWKVELLKRQKPVSLKEQIARMIQTLLELPGRLINRLESMATSGALLIFFQDHLAALIGLMALMVFLAWGSRRLAGLVSPPLAGWETQAHTLRLRALASLGRIAAAHLLLLAALFWFWLFLWSLGLWPGAAWRGLFFLLLALGGLRLGLDWLKGAFAGKKAGGLLPVDELTAGFYRKYLQLLLVYLVLGLWVLGQGKLLGFPPTTRLFLGHVFRVGLLAWAMWLLRRRYLESLLPEIPGPAWFKRPGVIRALKGLVLLLLAAIILANLLGFQNLAEYLSKAGAFTGVALLFLGLLWLGLDAVLHFLLHPEKGWAQRHYPQQEEMFQRIHGLTRSGVTALLAAAAIFLALKAWGLETATLAWAFQWLDWGLTLGSVRLTPLTLGGVALVIYLGVWSSRLVRSLMEIRVFPRTGWDTGVQYTITATMHYAILIIGGIVALNILGFPLTNLALIAGALGVGIGFGLQNIVNNFISGLIILFERPIKVGDMLVIDGQWGTVKEIRVRSTVFETFDRYVLIIPNSELLSGKILNWTHYGWGPNRMELKVGVGYGSDVRQVTHIISEVCQANARVLSDPPPQVFFKAYGDSSLDFTIWIFLQHPSDRIPATHEINTAIFEAFQREEIEIPFPQRDLHIKNWPAAWSREGE